MQPTQEIQSYLLSLKPSADRTQQQGSPLVTALVAALPDDYVDRLKLLEDQARANRNKTVTRLMKALDEYVAANEPTEKPTIKDPIKRRKHLIWQKQEIAADIGNVFEKLGLSLCCPSGKPCNLRVLASEHNPKGQFRLIPKGENQAEVTRNKISDLLPFFRFADCDAYLERTDAHLPPRVQPRGSYRRD